MGSNNSAFLKEEDNDIDFNETTLDVPIPSDPKAGTIYSKITKNLDEAEAISISNVKSVS